MRTCETATVHLVLQGKDGVGKSVVASWLAEFLMKNGKPVCCIDGDPVNRSLGQYKLFERKSWTWLIRMAWCNGLDMTVY
jgi:adenylylsulfate kinase-like enzyme